MMSKNAVPVIKKGHYFAAKYRGNNGDLIVGVVISHRSNGHTVLMNLLNDKDVTKKSTVLLRRNKRVSKRAAEEIVAVFKRTKSKSKAREYAVDVRAFGERDKATKDAKKAVDKKNKELQIKFIIERHTKAMLEEVLRELRR